MSSPTSEDIMDAIAEMGRRASRDVQAGWTDYESVQLENAELGVDEMELVAAAWEWVGLTRHVEMDLGEDERLAVAFVQGFTVAWKLRGEA